MGIWCPFTVFLGIYVHLKVGPNQVYFFMFAKFSYLIYFKSRHSRQLVLKVP
jgi:hypothetical protein